MTRSIKILALLALSMVVIVAACDNSDSTYTSAQDGHDHAEDVEHVNMWEDVKSAVAVISPTEGNTVTGTVTFEEADGHVTVTWDLRGLTPNAQHAMHVHEFGNITSADGTAAGGHYNPEGHDHGLPENDVRHAGDFGNVATDAEGNAKDSLVVDNMTVADLKNPVIGRAVIVHAEPDDGGQPTGNAGGRIGQGVIGIAGE